VSVAAILRATHSGVVNSGHSDARQRHFVGRLELASARLRGGLPASAAAFGRFEARSARSNQRLDRVTQSASASPP